MRLIKLFIKLRLIGFFIFCPVDGFNIANAVELEYYTYIKGDQLRKPMNNSKLNQIALPIKMTVNLFKFQHEPILENPYSKIDQHTLNCPLSKEGSIESLATYLGEIAKSDIEKARAIYVWLCHNISYDSSAYNSHQYGDTSADGVLKSRKSVCSGFSNLYLALGLKMGLEIEKVIGYAKGYSYKNGTRFKDTNHAWNIINIDGDWKVFDATWGEGYGTNVAGKLVCTKEFDNYWFNLDPIEAIFSHLPEDKTHAHVIPLIDLPTYEALPKINKGYFEIGFDAKTVYSEAYKNNSLKLPELYSSDTHVEVLKVPLDRVIKINHTYKLEIFVPHATELSIIDSNKTWTKFEQERGVFNIQYSPTAKGKLKISAKIEGRGSSFHTILVYTVK